MGFLVEFAVYGALAGGNENDCQAIDVTETLQELLDKGDGIVKIDNNSMGMDPSPGNTKHFGARVVGGGEGHFFACQEWQTIDFYHTKPPG